MEIFIESSREKTETKSRNYSNEKKNAWNYFIAVESLCGDLCVCGMESAVNNFVDTPYLIK